MANASQKAPLEGNKPQAAAKYAIRKCGKISCDAGSENVQSERDGQREGRGGEGTKYLLPKRMWPILAFS